MVRIYFIAKWVAIGSLIIGLCGFAITGIAVCKDYIEARETALSEAFLWKIHVNGLWYYSNVTPEVGPNIITFIDGIDGKAKSFIGYRATVESTRVVPQKKNQGNGG